MSQKEHDSAKLQNREKSLLKQSRQYPGFPFVKNETFLSLSEVLVKFRNATLENVDRVVSGEIALEELPRPFVCLTGLPGVGKTTLARGIVKEYAQFVAERCQEKGASMNVMIAEFDEYADRYVGQGKEFDIDISKPFPPWILRTIGRRMDEDIAERLRREPNTIVICDRPGGTQEKLYDRWMDRFVEWEARPYGLLGGDITKGEYPFIGIPLHVTMIGVIGGPRLLEGVGERDTIIRLDESLEQSNARRRQKGLPAMAEEEQQWNKRGAPKQTVRAVHQTQWALLKYVLSPFQERSRRKVEQHMSEFVMNIIAQKDIRQMQSLIERYAADDPRVQKLWEEVQDVAKRQDSPDHNAYLLLWKLCWDFAGVHVLKHSLGIDTPFSRPNISSIIYNN